MYHLSPPSSDKYPLVRIPQLHPFEALRQPRPPQTEIACRVLHERIVGTLDHLLRVGELLSPCLAGLVVGGGSDVFPLLWIAEETNQATEWFECCLFCFFVVGYPLNDSGAFLAASNVGIFLVVSPTVTLLEDYGAFRGLPARTDAVGVA